MRRTLLKWLVDKNRREIISFIGAGIVVVVGGAWTAFTFHSKQNSGSEQKVQPVIPVETVRLKGAITVKGYGFYTPRGYVILDRIGFDLQQRLSAESLTHPGDAPIELELVRISRVIPVALARPKGGASRKYPMRTRSSGNLAVGEYLELFRAPDFTTQGTVLRKFVDIQIEGYGTEIQRGLLETTSIASQGDSGAPVVDRDGRVLGLVCGGSAEKSLVVPIELIMSEFPEAF